MINGEELKRFQNKDCKILLTNGKVIKTKIMRADSVSIAIDGADPKIYPAILLNSIIMIKPLKKDEKEDEKK